MVKKFRDKWGIWTAVVYLTAIFLFGIFSIGDAFIASASIGGLFSTLILPTIVFVFSINFFIGYWLGLMLKGIWGGIK